MISVLVAFRDSNGGHRGRLWDFVRGRLEVDHPDFEIVLGTDDGTDPFHKTAAYNQAARMASGDVFVLTDADTWVPPELLEGAARGCERGRGWWRPYSRKVKLLQADTERALAEGDGWRFTYNPQGRYEKNTTFGGAPPLVVPRQMYEAAPFDEGFRGWGSEDVAFVHSLTVLFGQPHVISGECVHLWHPRIGRSGADLWPGQASARDNQLLASRYIHARTPRAVRELLADRMLAPLA